MAFTKPKTGKDMFAAAMNNYIHRRVHLLITAVRWVDDECLNDEDKAADKEDEVDDNNEDEDEAQIKDDHRDQDDEEQDNFFAVGLGLVHKANCNPASCYKHILVKMWGSLTDEEQEAKEEEEMKVEMDCDQ